LEDYVNSFSSQIQIFRQEIEEKLLQNILICWVDLLEASIEKEVDGFFMDWDLIEHITDIREIS